MHRELCRWSVVVVLGLGAACGAAETPQGNNNNNSATCSPAFAVVADPTGAQAFCVSSSQEVCKRAFTDCEAELNDVFTAFSSRSDCETASDADCSSRDWSESTTYAEDALTCLSTLDTMACSGFAGAGPAICDAATGLVPPAASSATPASPGTLTGTLTTSSPQLAGAKGGYYDAYSLCLTAGQTLELETAAGPSGSPVGDTVLYLFDEKGVTVAKNDDDADGGVSDYYSHIPPYTVVTSGYHMVLVAGYDNSMVGSYSLSITLH